MALTVDGVQDFFGSIDYQSGAEGLMGLGGGLAGGALVYDAYDTLGDIGNKAQTQMQTLGEAGLEQTAFRPFSVTSATGSTFGVDAGGNATQTLSAQEQAMQDYLLGQSQNLFGQAAAPMAEQEQATFDRLMALQNPAAERERLALENRLLSQGRLGTSSNAYGGSTPEMLAFQTAQAEARNSAALQAMQQARADQMQQANLGAAFQGAGYMPQGQLLNAINPALTTAQLGQQAQFTGAGLYGDALASGLSAELGARQGQANLAGNLGASMLNSSMQTASGDDGWVGAIGDVLGSIFG